MTTGQTSTNDGYCWLAAAAGDTLATEPYYARSVDTGVYTAWLSLVANKT